MKKVLIATAALAVAMMAGQAFAAGNLGVGTATPGSKLDVRDSQTIDATVSQIWNNGFRRQNVRTNGITEWYFGQPNGTGEIGAIKYSTPGGGVGIGLFTGATYDQNQLTIGNYGTLGGLAYGTKGFWVINATGFAGIGTTAPTAPLHVVGNTIRLDTANTPAQGSACNAGDHRWDVNFIYVCTATNTWKRASLSTF